MDENCIDSSNRRVFSKVSYGFGEKAVRGLGTKCFQETSLCDTSSAVDISSSTDSDYGAGFAAVFPAVEYSEDIDAYNEEEEKDEAGLEELLGFNSSPFLQSSSSRPSRMPLSASNARRVPKSELWMQEMMNETGEEEESVAVDAGEVSSTECDSCQSFLEAAERSVVRWADDVTICEAPHDNDIETEPSLPPTPLDQSMLTEATTALTVEPVHTSCAHLALPPRLLLTSKMRHRSDFDDVKELLFSTSAGQATTIVLTFSNRKDRVMKLRSQAVLMRFDASQPYSSALPENSFSVHPQSLTALPNTEASLYVTFQPFGSGIYSGVLKIKCNKKSFTFLLRGENYLPQLRHDGAPNSLVATISQPEIRKALGDDEISISSTALKNRESIVAWIERSKGIQAPSSLYNPPTMLVVTPFKSNRLTQKEGQLVYHASIEFANHDRQKFVQPPNHCLITSPDCKR